MVSYYYLGDTFRLRFKIIIKTQSSIRNKARDINY